MIQVANKDAKKIKLSNSKAQLDVIEDKNGCWIPLNRATDKDGYYRIFYNKKNTTVHRVTYMEFKGDIPKGLLIRHKVCANPGCCNPDHLSTGTKQDNTDDRERDGHTARGERHGNSKLTEAQVKEIIMLLAEKITNKEIADKYNVNPKTISSIKLNKTWKTVPRYNKKAS